MKKVLYPAFIILLISMFATACISEPQYIPEEEKTEDIGIKVTSPEPNEEVFFPLIIKGEARGLWYFEAVLPVKLFDGEGNLLVETYVEALDSWMTEDFVPFEGLIEAIPEGFGGGTLLFEESNPASPSEIGRETWKFEVPISF